MGAFLSAAACVQSGPPGDYLGPTVMGTTQLYIPPRRQAAEKCAVQRTPTELRVLVDLNRSSLQKAFSLRRMLKRSRLVLDLVVRTDLAVSASTRGNTEASVDVAHVQDRMLASVC